MKSILAFFFAFIFDGSGILVPQMSFVHVTLACGWTLLEVDPSASFRRPTAVGRTTPLLPRKTKVTEGVRAAVLACVEKSTNSDGRIVEVNAFADFFAKAIGESKQHGRCGDECVLCVNLGTHAFLFLVQRSSSVSPAPACVVFCCFVEHLP